jgi:hypothetical protein
MLNNAFADFITYTIVARNGEGTATTFTKIQSFTKGNDGVSFTGTAEYYKLTNSSSEPSRYSSGTTIDTGWSTTPQTPTSTNQYLWNFNRNSKSDSTFNDSPVTLVTQFVEDGKGIASIGEEYQRGTSATVAPTGTWYSTFSGAGAITSAIPYMWNKTTITFTDSSTPQVVITLIAARGADSTVQGPTGPSGFLYYLSGDTSVDNAHITAPSPATGQIAIVENTSGDQAGYRYNGSAWVAKELINTGIIVADAIKAEQLQISSLDADATGTQDGIFLDGTNNSIKIFANGVLRVRIGNLS